MCGIFGVVLADSGQYGDAVRERAIRILAREAQSRGRDSSGLVFRTPASDRYSVFKGALSIRALQRNRAVIEALDAWRSPPAGDLRSFVTIGHSRLVTNGSQLSEGNNQPVVKDDIIGIHNGIIVNDAALWARYPDLTREFEIDTEVFLALIGQRLATGMGLSEAILEVSPEVQGTLSVALLVPGLRQLAIYANYGSLYVLTNYRDALYFASEYHPLDVLRSSLALPSDGGFVVKQIPANTGLLCDLDPFSVEAFGPKRAPAEQVAPPARACAAIRVHAIGNGNGQRALVQDVAAIARAPEARKYEAQLEDNRERVDRLQRCTVCLLPQTFPFIAYDAKGVCNYCRNYRIRNQPKPMEELLQLIEPYRRRDGAPDCIVPFSGGRDSTYALHLIKTELGLNPIAFTYDWGMVTDLGRRNIARVCGKLGVENVIVAADIHWKRRNIRKNLLAWLRRPHLGMIPLLMAGDKYFYYYVDQVKRQTGIRLNLWGVNPMENTDFKVGFLGVPPDFEKKHIYSLSFARQMKLLHGVGQAVLANPAYLNSSVPDTIGSFLSRSVKPHRDYYHLFDYVQWDEETIDELIRDEYEWEKAVDTDTTWRIGDGTAAFYNYVYYTVAGFSEHDTFRSNQIREGALTREEGLRLIEMENRPRYPTIRWYLDAIGVDFTATIRKVNTMPRLYA